MNAITPPNAAPEDKTPGKAKTKDSAPRKGTKTATSRDAAAKRAAKHAASKSATPKAAEPGKTVPVKDAAPADAAPADTSETMVADATMGTDTPAAPAKSRAWGSLGSGEQAFRFGDLVGGLAGMAVAFPQSMGLGIALFAAVGLSVTGGALSGLLSVAAMSLISGLGGNTRGMISAPNGPVIFLLMGSLAGFVAAGTPTADLPTILAAVVVLAGGIQILLGVTGGSQLIKYIPYQVVAGLVSAVGVLMIGSQLSNVLGGADGSAKLMKVLGMLMLQAPEPGAPSALADLSTIAWLLVPTITVVVTMLAITIAPRWLPRIPGIVSGFFAGLITYHAITLLVPMAAPKAWTVGAIPGLDALALDIDVAALPGLPWLSILASAVALAVIASIDCMVTAVVADAATGARHNSRRELMAQGIGQIVSGLLGGCGGGGTKGSTLTAIHTGGRRWPAVVAGVAFIVMILFLRRLGEFLPISVLAGVIIHVGLRMIDLRMFSWLRSRRARVDGIIALIVMVAAAAVNVVTGVGVGAVAAAVLFIRSQAGATAIHARATGKEQRSLRHRSKAEKALLDQHGDRILYIELRGHLFFGTVDRLFTELLPDLKRPVWIVVNMRRVQSLDMSGLNLLRQMTVMINAHGGRLLFANVFGEVAPDRKMGKLMRMLDPSERDLKAKTFKSTDKALEFAEDRLLAELSDEPLAGPAKRVEATDNELCKAMKPKIKTALRKSLRSETVPAKGRIVTAGEEEKALYLVVQGEVDIRLPIDKYHYKRLKRVGPGGFFGELGFLRPGPALATAVATEETELMVLEPPQDDTAGAARDAVQAVRLALGDELAERMRWANAEIRRLERW